MARHKKTDETIPTEKVVINNKNPKDKAHEAALKMGFDCHIEIGTLMFKLKDEAQVQKWLLDQFGIDEIDIATKNVEKRVPFSYGFR